MGDGFGPLVIDATDDVDHARAVRVLWRRRWLILFVTIVFIGMVGALISVMPKHYLAQALVLVGDRGGVTTSGPNAGSPNANATRIDPEAVQTEIEILQSPALAERVIRQLNLDKRAEFKAAVAPAGKAGSTGPAAQSQLAAVMAWARQLYSAALASVSPAKPMKDAAGSTMSKLVGEFLARLQVDAKGQSRVIAVQFDSEDPALAAKVVNTLVQDYQDDQVQSRLKSAKEAELWLQKRIVELRKNVDRSEIAIAKFRAAHQLYAGPGGTSLSITDLINATSELERAREARISADSTGLRNASSGDVSLALNNSQALSNLRAQEANIAALIAASSTELGDQNPKMQRLNAQLEEIKSKISSEQALVASSSAKVSAARRRRARVTEQAFVANLQKVRSEIAASGAAQVQLQELEREAQANRTVLENLLTRSIAAMPDGTVSTATHIVSEADVPTSPSKPKKSLLLMIGAFGGIVFSCVLALVLEKRKTGFRTFDEVEAETREICLGGLPSNNGVRRSPLAIARDGGSVYHASIKAIYTKLLLGLGSKSKVVVITSALPQEGKTTLALSLAALAGHGGHRTVLIDLDFWRRGASAALGFGNGPGMADLLERRTRFGDVIVSDIGSNIDVIRPGVLSDGYDLTRDEELVRLIEYLTHSYEFVIIDSPPVLAVSEILVLAAYADTTVMTARWDRTNRDVVKLALKRLRDAGASIGGVVLAMVDQRQLLKLGGPDATYFSKDLTSYYARRPLLQDLRASTAGSRSEERLSRFGQMTRSLIRFATKHKSGGRLIPLYEEPGTALLVIDVQDDLVAWSARHGLESSTQDHFFRVINGVSDAAAKSGVMIIYVRQEFGSMGGRLVSHLLARGIGAKGAPGSEIDPRVAMLSDWQVVKSGWDAFSNDELEAILRRHQIDQLCLVGLDVMGSIGDTARSAIARGFRVTFIRDGIVSTSASAKDRLLKDCETQSAFWITSQQFMERIEGNSRDDIAEMSRSLPADPDTAATGAERRYSL